MLSIILGKLIKQGEHRDCDLHLNISKSFEK